MKQNADVLYHYCSLEAFLSIIQNASLRLSDISKSNDNQECIYARDKVKQGVEQLLEQNSEWLKSWNFGYSLNSDINKDMVTYVACFSEKKDLLSQWRGYAADGKGIAIGFSENILQILNKINSYVISFQKVIYDLDEQEIYIKKMVDEVVESIELKNIEHVALELNTNYKLKYPVCKNSGFKEEAEWRIIFNSGPGQGKIYTNKGLDFSEVKYRVVRDKLVSYMEMDFSKIKQDIIKEIWIGPKAQVSKVDVMKILACYGYYNESYNIETPILISNSESPYC